MNLHNCSDELIRWLEQAPPDVFEVLRKHIQAFTENKSISIHKVPIEDLHTYAELEEAFTWVFVARVSRNLQEKENKV